MHGLEDGDHVTFREVNGMSMLNGKTLQVKGKRFSPQNLEPSLLVIFRAAPEKKL